MWKKLGSGWREAGELENMPAMSNVLPFRRPAPTTSQSRCDVVAVADDLFAVLDDLQDLVARAARMGRPAIEIERTVQNLLDAVGAVERAVDCIGEGSEAAPA